MCLPGSPLSMLVSERYARKCPIHAGFRAYSFAHSITTKHPDPLRRSRRRGAAWREQGLDCLSVSELSSPPPGNPRQGKSAPRGRLSLLTFFGEIKKEGRKVSGARCRSAQRHQKKPLRAEPAPTVKQSFQSLFLGSAERLPASPRI